MRFAHPSPKEASGDGRKPQFSHADDLKRDNRVSRLQSLLTDLMDPEELHSALRKVPESALRRYSDKFFHSSRNLMENFETRYGWNIKRAFAKFLAEAAQNDAFSADYDTWLAHIDSLAREMGGGSSAWLEDALTGYAKFAAKCRGTDELRFVSGQVLAYSGRFGHPAFFIREILAPLMNAGAPENEIKWVCSDILGEMENMLPEMRVRYLESASRSVKFYIELRPRPSQPLR